MANERTATCPVCGRRARWLATGYVAIEAGRALGKVVTVLAEEEWGLPAARLTLIECGSCPEDPARPGRPRVWKRLRLDVAQSSAKGYLPDGN